MTPRSAPRRRFPEGFNAGVAPMTHLWEPLRVLPKPLAVHLASEVCGAATRGLLHCQVPLTCFYQ